MAVLLGLTGDGVSDRIGFFDFYVVCRIDVPGRDGVWPKVVAASLVP